MLLAIYLQLYFEKKDVKNNTDRQLELNLFWNFNSELNYYFVMKKLAEYSCCTIRGFGRGLVIAIRA
jgi:hypothetical protein